MPGLFAEGAGEVLFELMDAGGEPSGALLRVEEVGVQRGAGDGGSDAGRVGRLGFDGVDPFEQVAVSVEEASIGYSDESGHTLMSVDRRQASRMHLAVSTVLKSRTSRSIILALIAAGWAAAAIGSITGTGWIITLGFLVSGASVLAMAKLGIEMRALATSTDTALRGELQSVASMVDDVASTGAECVKRVERNRAAIDAIEGDIRRATYEISKQSARYESIQQAIGKLKETNETLARRIGRTTARLDDFREGTWRRLAEVETGRAAIEGAVAANRRLLEKVGRRISQPSAAMDLADLAQPKVDRPRLSIAIPSYNRPDFLAECLDSLERELDHAAGSVEVCITDDASSDPDTLEVAVEYVRRSSVASLYRNPTNLGLERNLVQACAPCRGEYVLVLGNDDRVCEGSLSTILADIDTHAADVYLYDKARIDLDGRTIDRDDRTVPIEIPAGSAHTFPTLLDAARRQGILSTLGFISTVVFRRNEFDMVEAERYLDLTMYPLPLILLEAFSKRPLQFRNVAVVEHRSPRQTQKWSEAVGLNEEGFMRGGAERGARYFGTALAAALQRLIDRAAVDVDVLAELPERLLTELSLTEWIAQCRQIDPTVDDRLDEAVVADAERFSESFALYVTKPAAESAVSEDTSLRSVDRTRTDAN